MNPFSYLFLTALILALATQLWLAARHIRHVAAHPDEVPHAFRGRISRSDHQRAADYTLVKTRFGMTELIYGTVLLVLWTLGGGLGLLDDAWRQAGLGPLWTGVGVILSMMYLGDLLSLPFSAYRTFVIEARFGFNRTTVGVYLADLAKSAVLVAVFAIPLTWLALWLMEKSGALWWLYVWLMWMGFSLFMIWAYPLLIAPLFNRFTPLEDQDLKARIETLLGRCGFASKGIFVMDGSRRSAHGNAYFTGLGGNKRIVFFDTLLKSLEPTELEAVLAHELGHFRLGHVPKRFVSISALSLGGFALLGWLAGQPWFYAGLGLSTPSNHGALVLFALAAPVFGFFLQPVLSFLSRRHEFQADDYAAQQSDAAELIRALVKLYQENANTLTPDPLYSAFHDSHPPAPVRVAHLASKLHVRPSEG